MRAPAGPPAAEPRQPSRPSVAIVGAGRAGTALGLGLRAAGYRVSAVHSLGRGGAARLAHRLGAGVAADPVTAIASADLSLLTVPDRALAGIAAAAGAAGPGLRGRALVHCSGARPAAALAAARAAGAAVGACHPLQALAAGAGPEELRGVYFGIDADATLVPTLERLVVDLGGIPFAAPTGDRALYHAAAVLAGNAPVALLARAAELLAAAGVEAEVAGRALAVLLEGAARNARRLGPAAALTGPVVRGDAATVAAHLEALRGDPPAQHLYHRLSREMLRTVGAVGRPEVAALLVGPGAARPRAAREPLTAPPRRRRRGLAELTAG